MICLWCRIGIRLEVSVFELRIHVTSKKLPIKPRKLSTTNFTILINLLPVPCIFSYFVLWPINAPLSHKLSHYYMFRHYRVSDAVLGNILQKSAFEILVYLGKV